MQRTSRSLFRFLSRFGILALLAPASTCANYACAELGDSPGDELEVETVESAVSYPFCVDHPCADLNVRVLKDNIFTTTIVVGDACNIAGTGLLIGNHGTANAGGSVVKIYTPSTGATKSFSIPALSPGFSYLLQASVPKNSTVTVDANDNVAETNENQNTYKYYCI